MKANDESTLSIQEGDDGLSTHVFRETQFMAVTAYQNQQVDRQNTAAVFFLIILLIFALIGYPAKNRIQSFCKRIQRV